MADEATPYNPATSIRGTSIDVRFSWTTVAAMQREYGKLECFKTMGAILQQRDVEGIAKLISYASGMSFESVMAACPPLNPSVDALQDAWLTFLYGIEKKAAEDKELSDPRQSQSTSFVPRLLRRFMPASIWPPSGSSQPSKLN